MRHILTTLFGVRRIITLCICVVLLGGCTASSSNKAGVTLASTSTEALDVRDFLDAYMYAFNSRNMEKLVSFYATDTSVLVFAEEDGYVLNKDDLLSAFEMKKDSWANNNVIFIGYDIHNIRKRGGKLLVDLAFLINSASWDGKYPTSFQLKESVTKDGNKQYLIAQENM